MQNIAKLDSNPFRYCSEYFDKETKELYLRARYYDARRGRFNRVDPARDELNWYTYCLSNPLTFVDPSGNFAQLIDAAYYLSPVTGTLFTIAKGVTKAGEYFGTSFLPGFSYQSAQNNQPGYYYSNQPDTWQRGWGYNGLYDASFAVGTLGDMQTQRFTFTHDGKEHMIQLWKGHYLNLGSGAEIGFYNKNGSLPWDEMTWDAVEDKDMLTMSLSLYNSKGDLMFSRSADKMWWMTGFNPKDYSRASQLTAKGSISFSEQNALWDSFYGQYRDNSFWTLDSEKHTANFNW